MVRICLILILQFFLCCNVLGQNKKLSLNEKIAINNLKDHIKFERKNVVAKQIKYPLFRNEYFDYVINDEDEFLNTYEFIFDRRQIEGFSKTFWEYYLIHGFEFYSLQGNGYVGEFDDNGIFHLTHIPLSDTEIEYINKLVEKEREHLHISLKDFVKPVCVVWAGNFRIRIDLMRDNRLRYSSWKKHKKISSTPDLVIYGGEIWGTRWGTNYTFVNGEYKYEISDCLVSETGPTFVVSKNDKPIMEINEKVLIKYFDLPFYRKLL